MPLPDISRRRFLTAAVTGGILTSTTLHTTPAADVPQSPSSKIGYSRPRTVGALYFRAQLYTIVPRQVREDMEWMRDAGINTLVIGVLEQDLASARENIDVLCSEARRAGLKVWAIPSRWGNLVAGAPKVPCVFTGKKPDCWALRSNGKPWMGQFGPYASIHHEITRESFSKMLRRLLTQWLVEGVVWDEPKAYNVIDHSLAAQKAFGGSVPTDVHPHRRAFANFFGELNAIAKEARPGCHTSMFTYATLAQDEVDNLVDQSGLDAFGCDGRPWALADGGADDSRRDRPARKCLIDDGPRFIAAARKHGKKSFALIENHALPDTSNPIMDRRLPDVVAQGWDHLICYYYPRSCDAPDTSMAILKKHLLRI